MTGDLTERSPRSFAFGPFLLVPERQLLLQDGTPVRIGNRALDLLTALVERPGELVSKRELMARAWPNIIVEEGNLKVNMGALRRALGDGREPAQYIATVTGRGYQFVAPVQISAASADALSSSTAAPRTHNLPTGAARIFGRADAIDAIRRDLDRSRLVSMVGLGGIGKTTVALAVAEQAIGSFKDGIWLVDLAPVNDPALVPNTIAAAIGLAANAANMLAALCEYLRDREMLLVLDNCEHVIDAARNCANQVLSAAAGVKILATSREPLQVKGERVRRLPGLSMPAASSELNAQAALAFPAIQLFVDRATEKLESFELSDTDARAVAEICRRLDGLALAIEFAATRVDAFGVRGLLKQLDDRFRLLGGRRAGPARHRTLMATLDWSYSLLPEHEAAVLRAVSVFASVFDIEGASAVAHVSPPEAAAILAELVAKSLLVVDLDGEDVAYRLLETTRAYGLDKLQVCGEAPDICLRHAEHVCAVLERAAGEWARRPSGEWGAAYGSVVDDLRAALAWAGRDAANRSLRIRLTVAGLLLWNHFSLTEECSVHVARALDELDAAGLVGTAAEMRLRMSFAGAVVFMRGPVQAAMEATRRALEIAIPIGDLDHHLRCLRMIGTYQLFNGEHEAATRTLESFVSIATAADPTALPEGQTHLAIGELFLGRLQCARQRVERIYERDLQDYKDPRFARFLYDRNVGVRNVLSHTHWLMGSTETALHIVNETIEAALKTKHQISLSNAVAWAGLLFLLSGQYRDCRRCLAVLEDQVMCHGIIVWRPVAVFLRGVLTCMERDEAAAGIEQIERAITEFRSIGHLARLPFYLGVFAESLAKFGRMADAEATIRDALDAAYAQNEGWCLPEVLRIRASMLIAQSRVGEAEACLFESMAVAEKTAALMWQLRAANELAQLWRSQSRVRDARAMLLPIYSKFTEGFTMPDLTVATELLAEL